VDDEGAETTDVGLDVNFPGVGEIAEQWSRTYFIFICLLLFSL
jgi:hypothetical protein